MTGSRMRWVLAGLALVSGAGGLAAGDAVAGDATRGEQHYALCATCHGDRGEGQKASGAPRLAGQHEWYIARQLAKFRTASRGSHADDTLGQQMATMANTLPGREAVEDVAAYESSLDSPAPARTLESGDAVRGKSLFAVCEACHGANGEGSKSQHAPRLAGQHDWYLVRQLRNFKTGLRGSDPKDQLGQLMRPMAGTLPDDQAILDVVAHIATLR